MLSDHFQLVGRASSLASGDAREQAKNLTATIVAAATSHDLKLFLFSHQVTIAAARTYGATKAKVGKRVGVVFCEPRQGVRALSTRYVVWSTGDPETERAAETERVAQALSGVLATRR